jgi:hypothetical protein
LAAAALTLLAAPPVHAKPIAAYDFETQAQVDAFTASAGKGCEVRVSTTVVHGGKQAVIVHPDMLGGQSASIPLPKGFDSGCLSFWFFDPMFSAGPMGPLSRAGWALSGPKGEIGFDNSKERPTWTYDPGNDIRIDSGVRRHHGWTKFDIVVEPDSPTRNVIVNIDGREAMRIPSPGFKPSGLRFCTFWGAGDITVDDINFDDDLAVYRPAAIQSVVAGDEAGALNVAPGQQVPLSIGVDRRGASAPKGVIDIDVLDLSEKSVAKQQLNVDWATIKEPRVIVSLPVLPSSRHYWLVTTYRDEGQTETASQNISKMDVQYLADSRAAIGRGKIPLAQAWDWMPASRDALTAPPAKWDGAQKFTKLWYSSWERKYKDVTVAWYRRSINVPKEWAGRRMLLSIEQPQTAVKAFIDGVPVGSASWPGGEIDLTGKVKPGVSAELVLLVDSEAPSELTRTVAATLAPGATLPEQFRSEARGLGGEVALVSEPLGARVDDFTTASKYATRTMTVTVNAVGLTPGQPYAIEGSLSTAGRIVKAFKAVATKATGQSATFTVEVPWGDLELWDILKPNLYDLNVALVSGTKSLDAALPKRVGFREVVFDGRLVKINGNPVSFFVPMPTRLVNNFGFVKCMERNNMTYLSSNHFNFYASGGSPASVLMDDQYDLCDEAGYGGDLGISDISLRKYLVNVAVAKGGSFLDDTVYWPAFEQVARRGIKRYGNRPSVFFLQGGGNGGQLEMGNMFNPVKMDGIWQKQFDDRPVLRQAKEVELKALTILRRISPSMPIIGQDAGNFLDAIHITNYAGFMPIQEMIEADEYWLKYGTKPYLITEQTAPWVTDWTTGARLGHNSPSRYDTIAERAAAMKGDVAFHRTEVDLMELAQFERRCEMIHARDPKDRSTMWPPLGPLYGYQRNPGMPSLYRDINYQRSREQWLNWRAEGLSMLCNWDTTMEGKDDAVRAAWAPVTGYIAGSYKSRTDKTHILRPGETWERVFTILNNRRDPAIVTCAWKATLRGATIASGTADFTVTPGGQATAPMRVDIPGDNIDGAGTLTASLTERGSVLATDSLDFQIVAPLPPPVVKSRVALVDPAGDSALALDKAGIAYDKLPLNASLARYDVVIFGRKAFSYEATALKAPIDLGALLAAGKRVLVLEQEESVLRNRFKFRTEYVSPRWMFARIAGHPVTANLPDSTLSFWRGSATLTDGYDIAKSQVIEPESNGARWFYTWNDGKEHPRQMKWGNSHNVATVVIDKPDRGNFRTIIDCEYNLDYAAVLELQQGPGSMVFCQADVTGRTESDPAAERLLANMVSYLDRAKPATWTTGIAYLGGAGGVDVLDRLQATYRKIATPDDAKPGETLVLGDALSAENLAAWKPAIARFVEAGGTCLSMPRAKTEWGWLPFDVGVKDAQIEASFVDKPSRSILAGISNGELYYAGRVPVVALDKLPAAGFRLDTGVLGEVPWGKGRFVFSQVAPATFDTEQKFYLEEAPKHTYRIFENLLNNIGVPMAPPQFLAAAAPSAAPTEKRPPLDLATSASWSGIKAPAGDAAPPAATDPRWQAVKVPGYVNDQNAAWDDRKPFVFWYRCRFTLTNLPQGTEPTRLQVGAIDDEDDVTFNGTPIGHTGRDTNINDWLLAPRYYNMPVKLFKVGENEIIFRVVNLEGKCGIPSGPVRLLWGNAPPVQAETSPFDLANMPPVDVAGPWWKILQLDPGETAQPADSDSRWRSKNVPGTVVETESRTVWCRRDIQIKEIPAGARPVLTIGAVDDEDDTYINGTKLGHIGKDTNPKDYWAATRSYPIPAGVLKPGNNRVVIKVNNLPPGPGSIAGPVQINWIPLDEAAKLRLSVSPYLYEVGRLNDPYWWCGGW